MEIKIKIAILCECAIGCSVIIATTTYDAIIAAKNVYFLEMLNDNYEVILSATRTVLSIDMQHHPRRLTSFGGTAC